MTTVPSVGAKQLALRLTAACRVETRVNNAIVEVRALTDGIGSRQRLMEQE